MRNLKKRNFIIVADIATGTIKAIVEGLNEQKVSQKKLNESDGALLKKMDEFSQQFPTNIHDVILTRAFSLKDLKQAFSRFSGWKKIKKERIVIA